MVAVARRLLTEMEQALASMEEHYAASQERLAQLLSASPAVIYSFKATADFAPTFVSDNITSVFGYPEYLADPSFWRDRSTPAIWSTTRGPRLAAESGAVICTLDARLRSSSFAARSLEAHRSDVRPGSIMR